MKDPFFISRIPAPAGSQWLSCRFLEAIPEYLSLLQDRAGPALDPFVAACLERLKDRWSQRRLSSLTTPEIQLYLKELASKGHQARRLQREKTVLESFYKWALRRGWTDVDPTATLASIPVETAHALVVLTAAEQSRLLEVCKGSRQAGHAFPPPYLHSLVLLALRTGLRLGDLLSLEWRHWDPVLRRIRIPGSEVPTGRDIDVPLAKDSCQELEDIERMSSRWLAVPRRILGAVGLPISEGQPDEHAVLLALAKARRRAGIREGDFLSLRLTYLRNCAMAGVSLAFAVKACDWDGDWSVPVKLFERHAPQGPCARSRESLPW